MSVPEENVPGPTVGLSRTSDHARHVNLLDVSRAGDSVVITDYDNNLIVLQSLHVQGQAHVVGRISTMEEVHDVDGNVRINPASNIIYFPLGDEGSTINNAQEALDYLYNNVLSQAMRIFIQPHSTAVLALTGADIHEKLSSQYPEGTLPSDGDVTLVGYELGIAADGNSLAGAWVVDTGIWTQQHALVPAIDERIQLFMSSGEDQEIHIDCGIYAP